MDLLIPAVIVFSLILIGVALTIVEFRKMAREEEKERLKSTRKVEDNS